MPLLFDVVGYAYDADLHCVACARRDYELGNLTHDRHHPHAQAGEEDQHGMSLDLVGRGGDLVWPYFYEDASDEADGRLNCIHIGLLRI